MGYALNLLTYIVGYISIPVVIRYAILRRPIHNKWVAVGILIPIFIGFAILINVQRAEMQKKLLDGTGVPYKSSGHMIGSPILYVAMFFSYSILRRGSKKTNIASDSTSDPLNDVITPLNETEKEKTVTDQTDYASNDIVPQKLAKTINISAKSAGYIKKGIIFVVCLFVILGAGLSIYIVKYPSSIHSLRVKAVLGSAEAQSDLGFLYGIGKGIPQDYTKAAKWFSKAAEQGDDRAQFNLGVMSANGQGVPQDYAEAVKWYRKAAEQGDSNAQLSLGVMYADGQGVPKNDAEALKWWRKAAEHGDTNAQFILGFYYACGDDPQNYSTKWWRMAAEQGDIESQITLGHMYANGSGVPKDYVLSNMWFNLAAANSPVGEHRDIAIEMRDSVASRMNPAQIAQAQKMAMAWKPKKPGKTVVPVDPKMMIGVVFRMRKK